MHSLILPWAIDANTTDN